MKAFCEVEGCGTELPEGRGSKGGSLLCDRCRSSSYTWKKADAERIQERRANLTFWSARLEYFAPRIKKLVNAARTRVAVARRKAHETVARH